MTTIEIGDVARPCPICDSTATIKFATIGHVPVFCNLLWESREQAVNAAIGNISLRFCRTCGHVYNGVFDPDRLRYGPKYETSLYYSPTFQDYSVDLAEKLVRKYDLHDKDVIEIGCGKGDFLYLLAQMGNNRCLGFDPSYDPRRNDQEHQAHHISVVQDYYSERHSIYPADFVVCRQMLEHVADPRGFMKMIRRAVQGRDNTVVFVEVPNVMFTLKEFGIWDLIYEHYSYFTPPSLIHLFLGAGFLPLDVTESFGGQYLCIEGKPFESKGGDDVIDRPLSVDEVEHHVRGFLHMYTKKISKWEHELESMHLSGIQPVLWGAGSKGITFLNVMKCKGIIDVVIDINPHKQGLYVPGTGQRVASPDILTEITPEAVIVMNPLYIPEISNMIAEHQIGKDRKVRLMDAGR